MPSFLSHLPEARILAELKRSPGHEIRSGKFDSPDSSAALTANAFGLFLEKPALLPPLPGVPMGQVEAVELEAEMRFPWTGGRNPWLDVGVTTATTLVGLEARRYEPFRPAKATGFAEVYDRPVWGPNMGRYTGLMHALVEGREVFEALDAAQLVKSALALRTQGEKRGKGAVLVYLYAEPQAWAGSGKAIDKARVQAHRDEISRFSRLVRGDSVVFQPLRWADLLAAWSRSLALTDHVAALRERFGDLG